MTLSGLGTFDFALPFEQPILVAADGGVLEARSGVAAIVLLSIIILSGSWILDEGAITSEVWGLLLVVPLTIVIVVSIGNRGRRNSDGHLAADWDDEPSEWDGEDVGDPEESGFDVPVL